MSSLVLPPSTAGPDASFGGASRPNFIEGCFQLPWKTLGPPPESDDGWTCGPGFEQEGSTSLPGSSEGQEETTRRIIVHILPNEDTGDSYATIIFGVSFTEGELTLGFEPGNDPHRTHETILTLVENHAVGVGEQEMAIGTISPILMTETSTGQSRLLRILSRFQGSQFFQGFGSVLDIDPALPQLPSSTSPSATLARDWHRILADFTCALAVVERKPEPNPE